MPEILIVVLVVLLLVPAGFAAVHIGLLALASLFYRACDQSAERGPLVRFLIIIPAHNEEMLLPGTLGAIGAAKRSLDQVLVVDDRSTDRTAEISERAGAIVIRRDIRQEPGRAAARQAGVLAAECLDLDWDALVMIDADSVVASDFFEQCERALNQGYSVIQVRSEAAFGKKSVDQFALASFAMQGVMLPRGREALRLPVRLRGTGMVFQRAIVPHLDFRARASEDLQVTLDLIRSGFRIRHLDSARLRSANAGSWKIASTQKQRYEAGRMASARTVVPLMTTSRAGFEMGWYIISPPYAVAVGLALAGTMIGFMHESQLAQIVGFLVLGCLVFAFIVSWFEAELGPRMIVAVLLSPLFIAWKVVVQSRALIGLRVGLKEFGATPRGE